MEEDRPTVDLEWWRRPGGLRRRAARCAARHPLI
jgi:hypothetical protein